MSTTTSAGKIPRPPEHMMRYMGHTRGKAFLWTAVGSSFAIGFAYYFLYVEVRRKALIEFGKNYDPYQRMREICEYPVKYMHACPDQLAKRLEEKGIEVGDLDYKMEDLGEAPAKPERERKEYIYANAIERFLSR